MKILIIYLSLILMAPSPFTNSSSKLTTNLRPSRGCCRKGARICSIPPFFRAGCIRITYWEEQKEEKPDRLQV
jgi:hypothetical protein